MSDTAVTERLLDAEIGRVEAQLAGAIGRSHAELAGRIEVLTQAQRDQVAAQDLASRLASEEHARVQQTLVAMGAKLDGLLLSRQTDEAAEAAVAKWRKRAIGAAVTGAGLAISLASVLLGLH